MFFVLQVKPCGKKGMSIFFFLRLLIFKPLQNQIRVWYCQGRHGVMVSGAQWMSRRGHPTWCCHWCQPQSTCLAKTEVGGVFNVWLTFFLWQKSGSHTVLFCLVMQYTVYTHTPVLLCKFPKPDSFGWLLTSHPLYLVGYYTWHGHIDSVIGISTGYSVVCISSKTTAPCHFLYLSFESSFMASSLKGHRLLVCSLFFCPVHCSICLFHIQDSCYIFNSPVRLFCSPCFVGSVWFFF